MFCPKCGKELPDGSQFCLQCGQSLAGRAVAPPPIAPRKSGFTIFPHGAGWILPIIFIVVLVWGWAQISKTGANGTGPHIIRTTVTQPIANAAVTVNADGYSYYKFEVPPGATNVAVDGHFSAAGGIGNDIEVCVLSDDAFVNFQNHHSASTFFNSGKLTQSAIHAVLPAGGGTYYLLLNNNFSLITPKAVQINAVLHYTD